MTNAVARETATCPNYGDPGGEESEEGEPPEPNSSQPEPDDEDEENECACSGGESREPQPEEGGSREEREAEFGQDIARGVGTLGGAIIGAARAGAFGAAAAAATTTGVILVTGGILLVVGGAAYLYFRHRRHQAREARIRGSQSCAAFGQAGQQAFVTLPAPGGEPGRPIDTGDVVTQCMCNARAPEERHRLFPTGDRCGANASQAQCAITPLGPDDRPRAECVGGGRGARRRRTANLCDGAMPGARRHPFAGSLGSLRLRGRPRVLAGREPARNARSELPGPHSMSDRRSTGLWRSGLRVPVVVGLGHVSNGGSDVPKR